MTEIDAVREDWVAAFRESLLTIGDGWAATEEPTKAGTGTGGPAASRLPSSTIVLRADVVGTLGRWVRATLAKWPAMVETATWDGTKLVPWRELVDFSSVWDMAWLLSREAERFPDWEYAEPMQEQLAELALEVRHVVRPPKKDRVPVGSCPFCGDMVVMAPTQRVPVPTTDPRRLAPWTYVPTTEAWPAVVRHRCGAELAVGDWYERIVKPHPLVATDVVRELHRRLGMRFSPITLRTWHRRGLVATHGYSTTGHALYDLREVLQHVVSREVARDAG